MHISIKVLNFCQHLQRKTGVFAPFMNFRIFSAHKYLCADIYIYFQKKLKNYNKKIIFNFMFLYYLCNFVLQRTFHSSKIVFLCIDLARRKYFSALLTNDVVTWHFYIQRKDSKKKSCIIENCTTNAKFCISARLFAAPFLLSIQSAFCVIILAICW